MSSIHIIISGASSVGKSTLVDKCLRKFSQDKKLKNKQFKRIQEVAPYIHYYFKNEQKVNSIFRSELFQSLINQCQNGLIFIIQPQEDLQAQNDNIRIVPNYQDQIEYTDSLKYWYRKAHLPYFVLTDLDLTKRVEFIEKHINGYFHWLSPAIPIPLYLPFHLNKQQPHHEQNNIASRSHLDQSYMHFIEISDKQNIKISYKKYDKNR
ncbi:unnamed protein product, partial [Rotaria sp. Silwood2]